MENETLTSISRPHMSQSPESHRERIISTVTIQTQHVPNNHVIVQRNRHNNTIAAG